MPLLSHCGRWQIKEPHHTFLPIMLLFCTLGVTDIQPAIASSGRSDSKKALRKSCAPCQSLRQQTLTIWCGMKTGRVMWPDVSWGSAGHSRQTMRTWKTWRTCQPSPPQGHLHATWVASRAGISSELFEYASMIFNGYEKTLSWVDV